MRIRIILLTFFCVLFVYQDMSATTTDYASLFSQVKEEETPILAQKKDKWGYVNSKGKFIIKPRFEEAYEFDGGHAIVKLDGKYGIILTTGDFWYAPTFDKITKEHFDKTANNHFLDIYYYKLCRDGKVGLFDPLFRAIGDPFTEGDELPYDSVTPVMLFKDEIVFIGHAHNKVFFFGKSVEHLYNIKKLEFDEITNRGDVFCTRVGKLYGYISQDFSFVCTPRFTRVIPFLSSSQATKFFDNGVPYVLMPKQFFTADEYDEYLYKSMSVEKYLSSDELPSWMRRYVLRETEEIDNDKIRKQGYNRVRKMDSFENWARLEIDDITYLEMKYFAEAVGDNEIRHPISSNAISNGHVASIFHYYNTEDEQLRVLSIDKDRGSFIKYREEFNTHNTRIKISYYKASNACGTTVSLSTIKQAICSHESSLKDASIVPLSFGVLENGNYLLHVNVLYNFRTEVIATEPPTFVNVFGQPFLVNDGIYRERRNNSFDVGLVLNKTDLSVISYIRPEIDKSIFLIDNKGGFFCCHEAVLAIKNSPLKYYDDNGKLRWSFTPEDGDAFKWLDGTDKCWYLVGKTTSRGVIGGDNALFLTMDNNGRAIEYSVIKDSKTYDDVKVDDEWVYTLRGSYYYERKMNIREKKYAPRVESVRWGDMDLYACGVHETKDGWFIRPVLPNWEPVSRGGWIVYPFEDHYAKVIHDGKEMFLTEAGEIVSSPSNLKIDEVIEEVIEDEEIPKIEQKMPPTTEDMTISYADAEEKPTFNGGDANRFASWVNSQLVYPEEAKENGIQGRILLQFTVLKDGRIADVKVIRGVEPSLDNEAIRVVSSSPKWAPGRANGQAINVTYTFPVIFQLK